MWERHIEFDWNNFWGWQWNVHRDFGSGFESITYKVGPLVVAWKKKGEA